MKKYSIKFERNETIVSSAFIELEAESEEKAMELAEKHLEEGMVDDWNQEYCEVNEEEVDEIEEIKA